MDKIDFISSSGNVFTDGGFNDLEAKNLKFRSHLMTILVRYIQQEHLTQKEAAKILKVSQPRISNLFSGKIDLFSVDMLLDMVERAGFPIYKKIVADATQCLKKYVKHSSSTPL